MTNFNCFYATGYVIQKAELYKLSKVFLTLTGLKRLNMMVFIFNIFLKKVLKLKPLLAEK